MDKKKNTGSRPVFIFTTILFCIIIYIERPSVSDDDTREEEEDEDEDEQDEQEEFEFQEKIMFPSPKVSRDEGDIPIIVQRHNNRHLWMEEC